MVNRGFLGKTGKETVASDESRTNRRLLGPKRLIFVTAVFSMAFLAWGYNYIQAPVEGTIYTPRTKPQTESVSTTVFSGKLFSLELPGSYKRLPDDAKTVAPTLEQYSFSHVSALENRRISITIRKASSTIFSEESALVFRQRNPAYTSDEVEVAGQKAIRTVKKDGSEITLFIPGSGAYAIIATTSTNPRDSYSQEVTGVIKSFRWK